MNVALFKNKKLMQMMLLRLRFIILLNSALIHLVTLTNNIGK
jgi:hypothetical protein